MKIVEVTPEQFNSIWNRLLPAQRLGGDVPTPAILLPWLNTLLVIEGEIQYGSLVGKGVENMNTTIELPAAIKALFAEPQDKAA
jgi:hypothetical protein